MGSCSRIESTSETSVISYVDPFIGTGGKGKTYPGATVPFGMVQLSPDNGRNGWDWISGYFYPDSVIAGFSHLHLSGTGAGDLYDISFMPVSGRLNRARLDDINSKETVFSRFSHGNESASPGYYKVYLDDYEVTVELTATPRTGLQRYRYERQDSKIRLNLGYTRNWDKVTDSYIKIVDQQTIEGFRMSTGWAKDQRVYFVSRFSKPFTHRLFSEDNFSNVDEIQGLNLMAELDFDGEKEILIKTGVSSVSTENALLNLNAEQDDFDFEKIRKQAESMWEAQLGKVRVRTSEDNMVQFYTAMYHSMLAPTMYSDVNGEYKGADGKKHRVEDHVRYSTFSLWDTFRALHPWMTIVHPERVPDLIRSMLDFDAEYGQLPVWNMQGNETDMMIGYHSVPVIADAYLKGITGFDMEMAYDAMKRSALQDNFGIDDYKKLGYVPYDKQSWNVSLTQEYAFDDWAISQVAKFMGKQGDHDHFQSRAMNYRNHFDPETGFFRAKSSTGQFKVPFDPLSYHPEDYCEANAWQYYWYAPHDVKGLIELTGGPMAFEQKLDDMFVTEQASDQLPDWISGYIGQYVHGNEPGHHVPYLYQFVNAPDKSQRLIRQIMDELYTTQPDGLCGNEDCGQMSAWYLFSALGFYPVNPVGGEYILGSPEVGEAIISLGDGKEFKIIAGNQSNENVFVRSVKLNGRELQRIFITHEEIMKGGVLEFEMSNTPSNE